MTLKTLLIGAAAAPLLLAAGAASAQVGGIAVADPQAAIGNSKAYAAARTQIETTYKTTLDQAQARQTALNGELQPLITQFQTAQKAPGATDASLAPQYQAIQAKKQAGDAELQRLTAPIQRAQAYAVEQIQAKLNDAVQSVVRAKNVSMIVSPQAVLVAQPAADITPAITAELDRLVPSVGTTPPAGWQPGQQGQAAAAPVPATATPVRRNATGR